MQPGDGRALVAGAAAWAAAVPLVRAVGPVVARGSPVAKAGVLALADACAALCLLGSVRYHTLMAAAPSADAYARLLAHDLAGVVVVNAVR